jgi:hypothetical protein
MISSNTRRRTGCSIFSIIFTIIIIILGITKLASLIQWSQFERNNPNPKIYLNCSNCSNGIPIYDSWSITREVIAYGRNGDECEVSAIYSYYDILTLQPNAKYAYIDLQPHLYIHCPSGDGFVYTSHTTNSP